MPVTSTMNFWLEALEKTDETNTTESLGIEMGSATSAMIWPSVLFTTGILAANSPTPAICWRSPAAEARPPRKSSPERCRKLSTS